MEYDRDEIEKGLAHFTGTNGYYRVSPLAPIVATEGVAWLIQKANCLWLVSDIIAYQFEHKVINCPFQIWELRVKDDKTAVLTMREDNDKPNIVENEYDFTDFPLEYIKLYLIDGVILLPSEY